MDFAALISEHSAIALLVGGLGMLAGGFAKGAVGFALPMISVSVGGSALPATMAVAGMILPGVVTNIWQTFRGGGAAAWGALREHWRLNAILFAMIALCAQLVTVLPERVLFLALGGGVTCFGLVQLLGWRPSIPPGGRRRAEALAAVIAGFFGGLAGVWGPPIVLYFLALEMPKRDMVRAQGISFLLGSLILVAAHLQSGLLSGANLAWSAAMVAPGVAGMALGQALQDRLDPVAFRRATLFVLCLAGLNLLRRGLMG
ncbi:sulfite exporter TauE/SafE family protein [Rhodovulum sp. DZ06]|uniref:sulfite exporter TauE/SafE family protein n=1 Tax=Rhodovulum sp. DZ06 TaxID=3425126 RepID=UPI003D34074E